MLNVIIDNIDIWTSTHKKKKPVGRGSNSKIEFYGIKKLRELILDLAIHGKLVPQDSNDEPASELLKKIKQEKEQLVKDKKIKKQKSVAKISDKDKLYDKPTGWQFERLGNLAIQITDGTHHTPKYLDSGVEFISVKDIDGKSISFKDCKYISQEEHEDINARCNPELGDLLICRIGTLGRVTIVDTERPFSLFVSVGLLKFLQKHFIPEFAHIVMHSPFLLDQYQEIKAGGIHTNKLNLSDLPRLILPIAPVNEQQRIVTKVAQLMALCDQLEQKEIDNKSAHQTLVKTLLHTLTSVKTAEEFTSSWQRISEHFDILFTTEESIEELKQTILELAIMGKLVPQDSNDEPASELLKKIEEEKEQLLKEKKIKKPRSFKAINEVDPFEIPSTWQWILIGELGHDWGQKSPDGDFTYIDVSAINNEQGFIESPSIVSSSEAPSRARKIVKPGTVVYSTVRPYLKNICVIEEEYDPEPIASTAFAILHPLQQMPGKYFSLYFRSPTFVEYVESVQAGIAYPAINDKQFFGGKVPLPPLEEQHRIVKKVDELMALCDTLKANISEAQDTQVLLADAIVEQAVV